MISHISRKILPKLKWGNFGQVTNIRNITIISHKYSQQKEKLQQLVSFDDLRLQKHLKFLNDMCMKVQGNRKDLVIKTGFNYEVLTHLKDLMNKVETIKLEIKELNLLISDLKDQKDELYDAALIEKENFEHKLGVIQDEILQLLIPNDIVGNKDIIMEITPGVGGQEAMLFAKDMFEMYCNYASWRGWQYEILKYDTTDLGGIRNAHIGINGSNAFKILKYECGVHRVQRVPKTEKTGRIHTSTMAVAVLPQPTEIDIVINPSDIELEFKRSSGAGGQHVNTTDSCVRIYHKPSGIVTESQIERNQHKNREIAMKSLRAKLYERELEAITKETTSARKLQIGTAARSEKVRTYNFVQDRITDHRAHITVHKVQSFLKGEELFDSLSDMLQQWNNTQSLIDILNKYDST